jgi:hypothetical protein
MKLLSFEKKYNFTQANICFKTHLKLHFPLVCPYLTYIMIKYCFGA